MREFITYEWFTIFCLVGLVCITAAKHLFSLRFNDFIYVVGNSKYLKIYSKDLKFIDVFDGLLFTNLVLNLSILGFIFYNVFFHPIGFEVISFLKLTFAVAVILLVKVLLERLVGSIFEIEHVLENYLFQKTTYKNFTGLVLFVANMILLYALPQSKIVIYAVITLVFTINFIGFITSFKNHQNLLSHNIFYFLLYLCALEIGPYVILYKILIEFNS